MTEKIKTVRENMKELISKAEGKRSSSIDWHIPRLEGLSLVTSTATV